MKINLKNWIFKTSISYSKRIEHISLKSNTFGKFLKATKDLYSWIARKFKKENK